MERGVLKNGMRGGILRRQTSTGRHHTHTTLAYTRTHTHTRARAGALRRTRGKGALHPNHQRFGGGFEEPRQVGPKQIAQIHQQQAVAPLVHAHRLRHSRHVRASAIHCETRRGAGRLGEGVSRCTWVGHHFRRVGLPLARRASGVTSMCSMTYARNEGRRHRVSRHEQPHSASASHMPPHIPNLV